MSVVYFVRPVGKRGPVKIGVTTIIRDRIANLSLWSPEPLEVAAEIEGGRDVEGRFHAHFFPLRRHGEWFEWSPALEQVITEINARNFDISRLPQPANCMIKSMPRVKDCRPKGWTYDPDLLADILVFCAQHGITEASFGLMASRESGLVFQMRGGRRPGFTITNRIRHFMATYRPTEQASAA